MAQGHTNYVDDVPIVFSHNWKIPPIPNLPDNCVDVFFERPEEFKQKIFEYDYSLERKVLEMVKQWKIALSREIGEREQRIIFRQEEKRKLLEAEGTKLKEQLTQISYPSPDEFSGSESEDDVNATDKNKHSFDIKSPENQQFNSFGSILTPTVIGAQLSNKITNSSLEALSNVPMSKTSESVWNYNKNVTKLELADFENDVIDPFYSMELKTIDDLDILAQVLKTSVTLHSKVNKNSNYTDIADSDSKPQENEIKSETLKNDSLYSSRDQQTQNQYTNESFVVALPKNSETEFSSPNYSSNIYTGTNYYGNGIIYMQNTLMPYDSLSQTLVINPNIDTRTDVPGLQTLNKLRSKSVPEIVKELEEELKDSQQRRERNSSQEEQNKRQPGCIKLVNECANINFKVEQQNCDDFLVLKKLPKELQKLAMKISQMGFPLDRVCRITQQVHGDEKRV